MNQEEKNEEKEISRLEGELKDEIKEIHDVEKKMEGTLHKLEELKKEEEHEKEVTIFVNSLPKPWSEKTISFRQVVELSPGGYDPAETVGYTITYKKGPHENPEGSLRKNGSVYVKNKMDFYVTRTGQS
jgi:hypothetical protein